MKTILSHRGYGSDYDTARVGERPREVDQASRAGAVNLYGAPQVVAERPLIPKTIGSYRGCSSDHNAGFVDEGATKVI